MKKYFEDENFMGKVIRGKFLKLFILEVCNNKDMFNIFFMLCFIF